jgi:hypothetical protein
VKVKRLYLESDKRLRSAGQNPCGPLAGSRDRDRRPCEGFPNASATRPVASARTASRLSRDADARSWVLVAQISVCGFRLCAIAKGHRLKSVLPRTAAGTRRALEQMDLQSQVGSPCPQKSGFFRSNGAARCQIRIAQSVGMERRRSREPVL